MLQLGMTRQFNGSIRSGPVLCAIGPGISRVLADKPANSHQLSHTMAHAAPIAGFLTTTIRSHDLRRGTAQDAANLVTKIKGHATDAVAEYLGHNETKTTKRYIGGISDSVYTMRVEENFQDPLISRQQTAAMRSVVDWTPRSSLRDVRKRVWIHQLRSIEAP